MTHSPYKQNWRRNISAFLIVSLLLTSCSLLSAQTPTPAPPPPDLNEYGYQVALSGNYSSSTGNTTNNGTNASIEYGLNQHWSIELDSYYLSNPAQNTRFFVGPHWSIALSHIFKKTSYNNWDHILFFADPGLGINRDANGASKLATKVGGGFSVMVNPTLRIDVLKIGWQWTKGLGISGQVIGNQAQIATGITIALGTHTPGQ